MIHGIFYIVNNIAANLKGYESPNYKTPDDEWFSSQQQIKGKFWIDVEKKNCYKNVKDKIYINNKHFNNIELLGEKKFVTGLTLYHRNNNCELKSILDTAIWVDGIIKFEC
ncbi:MAG: hypothetical protein J6C46_08100 [Clostridia bacterium]|nr:hypothetical protein [Clostridia bacterium]